MSFSVWHTGSGTEYPTSLLEGPDGNIWMNDGNFNQITPGGTVLGSYFMGGTSAEMCTDGVSLWSNNINAGGSYISKCTTGGVVSTLYVVNSTTGAHGLAYGSDGRLWQAFYDSTVFEGVQAITTAGVVTDYTPNPSGSYTCVKSDGAYIWLMTANGLLYKYNVSGTLLASYTLTGFTIAAGAFSMCFDSTNGCLWIADGGGFIWKVTTGGTITSYAQTASFAYGIASDGVNLWWSDGYGAQAFHAPCSNPTSQTAYPLSGSTRPSAVLIDSAGSVYIADSLSYNTYKNMPTPSPMKIQMII